VREQREVGCKANDELLRWKNKPRTQRTVRWPEISQSLSAVAASAFAVFWRAILASVLAVSFAQAFASFSDSTGVTPTNTMPYEN
jgi:hypothetical protein